MTDAEIKMLKELYEKFRCEYGIVYRGQTAEKMHSYGRNSRGVFWESTQWYYNQTLSMKKEEFLKCLKEKFFRGKPYWIKNADEKEIMALMKRYYSINFEDEAEFKSDMDRLLHGDNRDAGGLSQVKRTNIRNNCLGLLGYSDVNDVPKERDHELNMLVINAYKTYFEEHGITYR